MKEHAKFGLGASLLRTKKLIDLDFLQKRENIKSPFYTSVFIEVLVNLNHILQFCRHEENGFELSGFFNEDIPVFTTKKDKNSYNDAVSLIRFMRNVACHTDSDYRITKNDKLFSFVFVTKGNESAPIELQHCKYDDDIAAVFGDHFIYINRHIVKSYERVYEIILSDKRFGLYKKLAEVAFNAKK
ncbi:hypothetical protein [Lacibacter sp. H407]|uniref:hypothetical protein n=1 Tax=Lacibacter sp. H407 TaxID=3133423 RepID=UPI0030BCF40E